MKRRPTQSHCAPGLRARRAEQRQPLKRSEGIAGYPLEGILSQTVRPLDSDLSSLVEKGDHYIEPAGYRSQAEHSQTMD